MLKIKDLLAAPERHCKTFMAVDARGYPTSPKSSTAVKWCLYGAIAYCYPEHKDAQAAANRLARALPRYAYDFDKFNDDPKTTHQMILDLVTKADV
jgi:hypothetical protein